MLAMQTGIAMQDEAWELLETRLGLARTSDYSINFKALRQSLSLTS